MSSLPVMTATRPICNVRGFVYFLPGRAAGTAVTFIPTFQLDGAAADFYSTFRSHPGTVISIVFLYYQRVYGNVRCSRQVLWSGQTLRCHLMIASGITLKAGRCPTR